MDDGHDFVDYYAVLEVDPQCSTRTLELAYRRLAKMYHPDHPETADPARFNDVIEAYGLLRKSDKRRGYDVLYTRKTGYSFKATEARRSDGMAAISDAEMHGIILMYLYRKRRDCTRSPGVSAYEIRQDLDCSDDHFEFHAWYLRKKGFIEHTEDGLFAITVEGVDHVIAMSERAERTLRITQATDADRSQWADRDYRAAAVQ